MASAASVIETYLSDLRQKRSSGSATPETSYYPTLENLLNAVGAQLKPKVSCILNIQNRGAGIPDGGLFTPDQFQKGDLEPLPGTIPSRGAIEAKPVHDEVDKIARGEQIAKYLRKYGQVLVTNFREFLLVMRGPNGKAIEGERYGLAPSEGAFWAGTAHPRRMVEEHGERLMDFLKRVMRHPVRLTEPEDVAWFLASYAREAKARIEKRKLAALAAIREAFEESLGVEFKGDKGDKFFRSSLVQTLFYGVFSAWVLWSKQVPPPDSKERFDWRLADQYLRVPVLRTLFRQIAEPGQLRELRLSEVLDWAGGVLNRTVREDFFANFEAHHAVQYFYEPFLAAYDPDLRKSLGVWYTPQQVVRYMVARVDAVLRDQLGIADGLADEQVYILDPCCGTGAYLVEVLSRIHETLRSKGESGLNAQEVKRAALQRVFGFEILPASFVIAHLQLGVVLQAMGAPLSERKKERASVFLTNALTGWEHVDDTKPQQILFAFPGLREERDAAEQVKQHQKILVILGNPPYNGFAGVAVKEERTLTDAYRTARRVAQPQGQGLNDLYVRFFRMAERRIVEKTKRGVVCFISNYSWLDGRSFTGMRERYLDAFDHIAIDCLNGDKYKTGKLTPEGKPDPSIFSTPLNREGIQVGTAITLLARREKSDGSKDVVFRNLWGKDKLARLLDDGGRNLTPPYETVTPLAELGFPFVPAQVDSGYMTWPLLPEIFPVSIPGVKTSRDTLVVDIDRQRLDARMRLYFDASISDENLRGEARSAMEDASGFNARETRARLLRRGYLEDRLTRYCYRPFDLRWMYWELETRLLDRSRPEYQTHVAPNNPWLSAAQRNRKNFDPPCVTVNPASLHLIERGANMFPARLGSKTSKFNLSAAANGYALELGLLDQLCEDIFYHSLSILHAAEYGAENAHALRQDWPRIPLPNSKDILEHSASLGRRIVELLDIEKPVAGVTSGEVREELRLLAIPSRENDAQLNPDAGDYDVTAGWGHAGQGGVAMPAKGKSIVRGYTAEERAAVELGARDMGLAADQAFRCLGDSTYDIYLNAVAYWKNVPARVWEYRIGGYQVIKKWLSYRERRLLGRSLRLEEIKYLTEMVRRIAAILLLHPELDANYESVKACVYQWPRTSKSMTHIGVADG